MENYEIIVKDAVQLTKLFNKNIFALKFVRFNKF